MSVPQYWTVGTQIRDPVILQNADGTFVTGKVQADFTLKVSKDGVGNQSTTGITITETDSVNNPGQYEVVVSNTLGFAATAGIYTLTVTLTATPSFTFEQTYVVNTTGQPGTTGAAFTATASNGRVTDGASPLQGASVIVTNGSGSIVATTTTNASGVWGPVYFTTNGVYNVTAQLSGYVSATATITVTGAPTTAVLSPATDIALAASTVSPLSASELWAYFTRQARDVAGTKASVERVQGVQDAVDMVAKACRWSWLLRRAYLTIHGAVNMNVLMTNGSASVTFINSGMVGSINVTNGGNGGYTSAPTVTITPAPGDVTGAGATAVAQIASGYVTSISITSAGSNYTLPPIVSFSGGGGSGAAATAALLTQFPSWAASGRLLLLSQVIDIETRVSDSVITMDTAWAGATTTVQAILFQDEYALPENMLWFHKVIPFQRWGWGGKPIGPAEFYERQAAVVYQQRFPSAYCIHHGALMIYPYTQLTDTLCYTLYIRPDPLVSSGDVLDWDPAQIEVIRRAIDVQVCIRYGSYAGGSAEAAAKAYENALSAAMQSDREMTIDSGLLSDDSIFAARANRTDWHRRIGL